MPTIHQEYRPIRELGRGGMGTVYLAEQVSLGRLVAIKALLPGALANKSLADRLRREAILLRGLSHPNLVRLLDAQLDGDDPFVVFEYIDGSTPLDALIERGALARPAALTILRGLLEGLEHLHDHDIIHRDIKPANVLVDAGGVPRLIDLGLGRIVSGDQTRLTQQGQVLGTMAYIPPEQLLGEDVDQRSDIYAAALVAAELLAGQFIFTMQAPGGPITAPDRLAATNLRLERRIPGLTPRLARWFDRCLARNPGDRPARLAEVRMELEAALAEPARSDEATGRLASAITAPNPVLARKSGVTRALAPAPPKQAAPAPASVSWRKHGLVALFALAVLLLVARAGRRPPELPPTRSPGAPAPLHVDESSIFRFDANDLVLEAKLSRPAQLIVRSVRERRELARSDPADTRQVLVIGSARFGRGPVELVAADEPERVLRLDSIERRLLELAGRHLASAQIATVVTALDRRRARSAASLSAEQVLPEGFADRLAALAGWIPGLLADTTPDASRVELWNRIETWGAAEDWCVAHDIRWGAPPSRLQPASHTDLLQVDSQRYHQLLSGLNLSSGLRTMPDRVLLWNSPFQVERGESERAWLQVLSGQTLLRLPETVAETGASVPLPALTGARPDAWLGYKPSAYQGTSMLYAVFDGDLKLRLPLTGPRRDWFRYRRLPPAVPRRGGLAVRFRYEQTPGTTRCEPQTFFGFHVLLTPSEIPSGPELVHAGTQP